MKIYSNVIHLSGRFIYPDDFAGNQSVRINEAQLYTIMSFGHFMIDSKLG
jgi:hypothetical protein